MSNGIRCHCPRCTIRGLMGPAVLITIGVLFLLQETRGGEFNFSNTYPFILIVMGAILLASSIAPMSGHLMSPASAASAVSAPPQSPSFPGSPQNPGPGQGQ